MKDALSSPAFQPLYRQIKSLITQSLMAGEWGPGEPIPSEIELAGRFSVSQGTVRKAINELADQNLLIRHQGKGTFVASHAEERRKYYFTRIAPDSGEDVHPTPELLECRRAKADAVTARLLDLAPGAGIFVVRRRFRIADQLVEFEEVRVPASLFRGLSSGIIARHECKLYSMYESQFGVRIIEVRERIKAVLPADEESWLLQVLPTTPLLRVDRVAFTFGDKPVEIRASLFNTTHHHYQNRIT
ncbi:MAG: GntR family transcriptional regulator [Burkholderiales bacterium]|jgi:GntR family transcriptional regulator|nr:GntR family transcriptional regulator [Burkholderiales bacterium]